MRTISPLLTQTVYTATTREGWTGPVALSALGLPEALPQWPADSGITWVATAQLDIPYDMWDVLIEAEVAGAPVLAVQAGGLWHQIDAHRSLYPVQADTPDAVRAWMAAAADELHRLRG